MKFIEVNAKKPTKDEEGNVTGALECKADLHVPEHAEEMMAVWGGDVVYTKTLQAVKIDFQAVIRRLLEAGLSEAEIREKVKDWKPGTVLERAPSDPVAALIGKWDSLSEDQKAKILAKIQG